MATIDHGSTYIHSRFILAKAASRGRAKHSWANLVFEGLEMAPSMRVKNHELEQRRWQMGGRI
jgi:hypothetical protein